MTTAVCVRVCMEGKGWVREGQCTLMRPTHNASFSQLVHSKGPDYLLPLPPSSALFLTGSLSLVKVV